MKITGYRSLTTHHDWGRLVGDVNGISAGTEHPRRHPRRRRPTAGSTASRVGAHPDIDRLFPAIDGADPRAVVQLYDRMLAVAFKLGHTGAVVRHHRHDRLRAVGPQGQDGRRAAVAPARRR